MSALVLSMAADRGAEFARYLSLALRLVISTFGDEPKSREDAERSQELISVGTILRSQVAYMLAMGLDSGKVKILERLSIPQ